jgi:hypothetical protein
VALNQLNWEELDKPDTAQVEEARKKSYEDDVAFLTTFSTPSGKKVLEWLTTHTLDTPPWWPSADYTKSVANGFYREGQNCLVREIKARIKRAKDYQEQRK